MWQNNPPSVSVVHPQGALPFKEGASIVTNPYSSFMQSIISIAKAWHVSVMQMDSGFDHTVSLGHQCYLQRAEIEIHYLGQPANGLWENERAPIWD